MSPITERKLENHTKRYNFTCTDDEIIDDKFLQLSDDVETWLCKTEGHSVKQSCINERLNFNNDCSAMESSFRHIDSRTYTRRKRCSIEPGLASCWELDMPFNTPTPINTTLRTSLGLLTPSLYNKTLDTDLLQDILKFTPMVRQRPGIDSLDSTGSETTQPKRFTLDLSSLTPTTHSDPQYKTNNLGNITFDKSLTEQISEIQAPSFSNINTPDNSMHNSLTTAASIESLEYDQTDINNLTNLSKEILHRTYEAENIAPAVNLNSTVTVDKPFNISKSHLNTTQTLTQNKSKTSLYMQVKDVVNVSKMNGQVNSHKSPLNTTFPKSQLNGIFSKTLNNTFTKSADALNAGTEDDQVSSASDSSFSSCSNLPRSVGDLHNIARLQEESLEEPEAERNSTPKSVSSRKTVNGKLEQHGSTPKSTRMPRSPIDEIFGEEQLSPIANSGGDDGNVSEQSTGSPRTVYSHCNNNNNRMISRPISAVMGDHKPSLPANSIISKPRIASRLRMPAAVSQASRIVRPAPVNPVGIRPISVSVTSIPRPSIPQSSRLPHPRFRGRSIPKQN